MKKFIFFIFFISGISIQSFSQSPHADTLSINNIRALVKANGMQFWDKNLSIPPYMQDTTRPIYNYPNGSLKTTIFNSCLWYGGIDGSNQIHFAGERYCENGTDFWTGPLKINGTAYTDTTVAIVWNKVWKINKLDLLNYISSTLYPNNPPSFVINWPAHGDTSLGQSYQLAPFIDINNNGKYEPYAGDYPKIYGDQCIFFIINDKKTHYESAGLPLGFEIHVFAYAFDAPSDSALNNAIFYKYKIINRSSNPYYNFYLGLYTDIDIGYAFDDYVACDVERSTYYGYNGRAVDGGGVYYAYDSVPPAQGVTILGGPAMDADALDNPVGGCNYSVNGINFGDGIVDNERLGMCRFIYYNNAANSINGDPRNSMEFYGYLKGNWKDGTALKWGGNGWDTLSTKNARFMFPGLSDTLNWGTGCGLRPTPNDWSEVDLSNAPGDRRGLGSMGPFTFNAGATKYVDVVYTTAASYGFKSSLTSVDILKQRIDSIRNFYLHNPGVFQDNVGVNIIKNDLKINIYPNPATEYVIIEGIGNNKTVYSIFNLVGQIVKSGRIESNSSKISVNDLKSGIYFVKLQSGTEAFVYKIIKK
ncbi:MAG: T9SS type A sorting domain-containing protein [Bacteroidetes bacterium]|nr:T9SS type A sorting domain-containing protein [Bacteroidota bacterium]